MHLARVLPYFLEAQAAENQEYIEPYLSEYIKVGSYIAERQLASKP